MALSVALFVGMFMSMVAITLFLRHRGILGDASKPVLSTILMDVIGPAVIFHAFASAQPKEEHLLAATTVYAAELLCAVLAYVVGKWILRLERGSLGVFIVAGTFGSTSLIGNALVQILFKSDPSLVSMSMIVSQFGFGLPANTIGILLAIHFGSSAAGQPITTHLKRFAVVPCMIALYAGLLWSLLGLPVGGYGLEVIFGTCMFVGAALPFVSAMLVGLSLEKINVRKDLGVLLAVSVIALLIEPLIVSRLLNVLSVDQQTRLITILFSAMPATPLAVVLAVQYGGDATLASKLSTATLVLSAASLPLIVQLV